MKKATSEEFMPPELLKLRGKYSDFSRPDLFIQDTFDGYKMRLKATRSSEQYQAMN